AEDGIRDRTVTGVQTCALSISLRPMNICSKFLMTFRQPAHHIQRFRPVRKRPFNRERIQPLPAILAVRRASADTMRAYWPRVFEIGRASCRERAEPRGREGAVM